MRSMHGSAPPPGWKPLPFHQFILKIQSRCNLDCDYCYVYHLNDAGWRRQPHQMALGTVHATARRIAEHAACHGVERVGVTLHGGEPLLGAREYLGRVLSSVRRELPDVDVDFLVQTNGLLLDDAMADFLVGEQVAVGISLDGDRAANDLHRTFRDGRSSYDATAAAVRRMARAGNRALFAGVLCTIQLAADPLRVWASLLDLGTPAVDFLLPHGTWSNPPPGLTPGGSDTPYADWLVPIFDVWFDAPLQLAGVRIFEDILNLVLGGTDSHESIGLAPARSVIIETDGAYEQVDSLKAAYDGATATGLNVFDNALDELLRLPDIIARQLGLAALSDTCRSCSLVRTCGGGLYPHRFRDGSGFRNPSVYCSDLFALILHIERRAAEQLARRGLTLRQVQEHGCASTSPRDRPPLT